MNRFILKLLAILCFSTPAFAQSLIETSAKQAIIVDYDTGTVLLEKNPDEQMPTSSMSKVMTMYMIFDALKRGDMHLDGKLKVSERAWRMEGSKMFIEVDKEVKIEDLIRGVIVQSGNDATVVLAEGLSGSEMAFSSAMTAKAKELGMNNSNFVNASGWPDPQHYSTARDLSILGSALVRDFPEYYPYYSETEFTYNAIKQGNRNPLLYRNIGADGIKTGHTEAAGYGLIGSGIIDGRRVMLVVNGLADEKERAQESAKLLEWGLKNFENRKLFAAKEPVENIPIIMSTLESIPAVLHEDLMVTLPKISLKDFTVTAHFKSPLFAPVAEGQEIGTLEVNIPHMPKIEHTLYAGTAAPKLGFMAGTFAKAKIMLSGGETATQ